MPGFKRFHKYHKPTIESEFISSAVRTFVAAEVNALFTTPLEIVPGEPGAVLIPVMGLWNKAAGAYTLGAANNYLVGWSAGGGALLAINPIGHLDQAGVVNSLAFGPGQGGLVMYSDLGVIDTLIGSALEVRIATADPTGAGGDATLTLWYKAITIP